MSYAKHFGKSIFLSTSQYLIMSCICVLGVFLTGCHTSRKIETTPKDDHEIKSVIKIKENVKEININTGKTDADDLVDYAETLKGIKYLYGSSDPSKGLDCSGFVCHVFNHFNIKVPRISTDYTNAGKEVTIANSKRGDLILFTGSDARSGKVGHLGIILENKNRTIKFIHSASGGGKGVTVSGMSSYYVQRFVKVIRVFD